MDDSKHCRNINQIKDRSWTKYEMYCYYVYYSIRYQYSNTLVCTGGWVSTAPPLKLTYGGLEHGHSRKTTAGDNELLHIHSWNIFEFL